MSLHTTQANGCEPARAISRHLFRRAQTLLPAGVSRTTVERDPDPIYITAGEGAYLIDADGNRYLDLNNNFTTLIHGHCFGPVMEGVAEILRTGTCFANPTEHELALAELLIDRIPGIERVRFVNSGTEAVMYAIKAARAFTGRSVIARFEGAYHGAYDWAEAGQSGTLDPQNGRLKARPAYRGCPESVCNDTLLLTFNDVEHLEATISERADELAAILIDPMPSRAGLLQPDTAFLDALREIASRRDILIIGDEVLNLRQSYEGACALYGLKPDLVVAGKIIGGGFPIGAIGGRADVMAVFDDQGKKPLLPQGGTFSANPVSMIAGKIAMDALDRETYIYLDQLGSSLRERLVVAIRERNAPFSINGAASLFRIHPKPSVPRRYDEAVMDVREASTMREMSRFFLNNGIVLPFGAASSLSTPMTSDDIDKVVGVFDAFLEFQSRRA